MRVVCGAGDRADRHRSWHLLRGYPRRLRPGLSPPPLSLRRRRRSCRVVTGWRGAVAGGELAGGARPPPPPRHHHRPLPSSPTSSQERKRALRESGRGQAGDDVPRKKPDPIIYQLAAEKLGLPADRSHSPLPSRCSPLLLPVRCVGERRRSERCGAGVWRRACAARSSRGGAGHVRFKCDRSTTEPTRVLVCVCVCVRERACRGEGRVRVVEGVRGWVGAGAWWWRTRWWGSGRPRARACPASSPTPTPPRTRTSTRRSLSSPPQRISDLERVLAPPGVLRMAACCSRPRALLAPPPPLLSHSPLSSPPSSSPPTTWSASLPHAGGRGEGEG
eukprot:1988153-Rhodomonas_salina.1